MGYLELKHKEVEFHKEISNLEEQIRSGDQDKSVRDRLNLARQLQAQNYKKLAVYESKTKKN